MVSTRTRHSYNSYTARRHWHPTNKENQPEASAVTETTTEPGRKKTVAQFLHDVAFNIRLSRHVSVPSNLDNFV